MRSLNMETYKGLVLLAVGLGQLTRSETTRTLKLTDKGHDDQRETSLILDTALRPKTEVTAVSAQMGCLEGQGN